MMHMSPNGYRKYMRVVSLVGWVVLIVALVVRILTEMG